MTWSPNSTSAGKSWSRGSTAARHLLRDAEGRLLRLPEYQGDRLEGQAAGLGAAGGRRRRPIGGPDFGVLGEGYVRLSYANSAENILRARSHGRIPRLPQSGVSIVPNRRNASPLLRQPEADEQDDEAGELREGRDLAERDKAESSTNGGTSDGNKTAREAPSSTTARVNR